MWHSDPWNASSSDSEADEATELINYSSLCSKSQAIRLKAADAVSAAHIKSLVCGEKTQIHFEELPTGDLEPEHAKGLSNLRPQTRKSALLWGFHARYIYPLYCVVRRFSKKLARASLCFFLSSHKVLSRKIEEARRPFHLPPPGNPALLRWFLFEASWGLTPSPSDSSDARAKREMMRKNALAQT